MRELKPYERDFARFYDLFVYGRCEVEADPEETAFLRRVFDEICPRNVKDVLDVGCGTGRNLIPLAREGYTVTGLDNSPGMLQETRRTLDKHGLAAELIEKSSVIVVHPSLGVDGEAVQASDFRPLTKSGVCDVQGCTCHHPADEEPKPWEP